MDSRAVSATRRRAAFAGASAVVAYLALAVISGSLSPLARRPLLDGVQPPPPYRWVNPPPSVSPTAEKPEGLTETVDLSKPERGAGQHATTDRQAQIILDPDSFDASLGKQKLTLTIEPLDPAKVGGTYPKGKGISGNVYRFRLATAAGADAPPFKVPGHLVLQYPSESGLVFTEQHTIVRLNGSKWEELKTTDSPAVLQASAETSTLGTFGVASASAAPASKGPPVPLLIGLGVGLAAVAGGGWWWLAQRRRAERRRARERARQRQRTPPRKP